MLNDHRNLRPHHRHAARVMHFYHHRHGSSIEAVPRRKHPSSAGLSSPPAPQRRAPESRWRAPRSGWFVGDPEVIQMGTERISPGKRAAGVCQTGGKGTRGEIGSLPLIRALGIRPATRRSQWRRDPRNGVRNCPSCTPMQPASMWARASCLLQSALIVIPNLFVVSLTKLTAV